MRSPLEYLALRRRAALHLRRRPPDRRRTMTRRTVRRRSSSSAAPHLGQRRSSAKSWAAGTVAHNVRPHCHTSESRHELMLRHPAQCHRPSVRDVRTPNPPGQIRWIDDDRNGNQGEQCSRSPATAIPGHSGKWSYRRVASLPPGRPAPNLGSILQFLPADRFFSSSDRRPCSPIRPNSEEPRLRARLFVSCERVATPRRPRGRA